MLILIGVLPTAYALNHAVPDSHVQSFLATSGEVVRTLERYSEGPNAAPDPRATVELYLHTQRADRLVVASVAELVDGIQRQVRQYGSLRLVPAAAVSNVRNDMYLAAEAIRHLTSDRTLTIARPDTELLLNYRDELNGATRFIPTWVKVAVAVALGLGTMVGWKRIVITVGEKIGKTHLTYAQGASAELIAATTIAAADIYGLPVSTTHVLSSGVAGTMAANRSGLQMSTVRNLAIAWLLTLPAAILLAGGLFLLFSRIF